MDEIDRSSRDILFLMDNAVSERYKKNQELIEAAKDLPDERYCEDCGELIPAARIKAIPYAVRCVDCQTKLEAER